MYKFEKLSVWQEALTLARYCYVIARALPGFENFGLSDQLRRAATSILLNIAEGSGSETDKEFLRFLFVARKSLYEVVAVIKFIEVEHSGVATQEVLKQVDVVGKLLNGLIRKLKANS